MASSYDIASELQIYVVQNMDNIGLNVATQLDLPDRAFNPEGIDEWIAIEYAPIEGGNRLIGLDGTSTGRLEYEGIFFVRCFNRKRFNTFDLADKVSTLLNGKQLPSDVRIETGQHSQIMDLEANLFQMTVEFRVLQN